MKRKSDGFSLVEVIIAVAILAIFVMFLLSYFSSAFRYANWGKATQKADLAAQSVVEELASYNSAEQVKEFLSVSGSSWVVVATPSPGGTKKEMVMNRNISIDGNDYTARVTMDFDAYKAGVGGGAATPSSKFNDYKVPKINEVYSDHNVVLEEKPDVTDSAVGEIFYQIYETDSSVTKSAVRNGITRKMYLTVDQDSSGVYYIVKGWYEYTYKHGGKDYTSEMPIKSVKIEKSAMEKVYLFYRPVSGSITEESLDIAAADTMPSGFQLTKFDYYAILQNDDTITVPDSYKLNLYSKGGTVSPLLKEQIYTNANKVDGNDNLIKHEDKDRIAAVTVDIYRDGETNFNEENRIVRLETSKGA